MGMQQIGSLTGHADPQHRPHVALVHPTRRVDVLPTCRRGQQSGAGSRERPGDLEMDDEDAGRVAGSDENTRLRRRRGAQMASHRLKAFDGQRRVDGVRARVMQRIR